MICTYIDNIMYIEHGYSCVIKDIQQHKHSSDVDVIEFV